MIPVIVAAGVEVQFFLSKGTIEQAMGINRVSLPAPAAQILNCGPESTAHDPLFGEALWYAPLARSLSTPGELLKI